MHLMQSGWRNGQVMPLRAVEKSRLKARKHNCASRRAGAPEIGADDELSKLSMSNYISKYPIDIEYDIDIEILPKV
jgi:hypothetical protein